MDPNDRLTSRSHSPLIGGGFAATNYRWFFYMNLPLSAIIFAVVAAFMDLPTPKGSLRSKLARMDWYVPRRLSRSQSNESL